MKEVRTTKRNRGSKAEVGIRAMWTFIFPGIGFALEWLVDIDKLIGFGFGVPVALGVGAGLYALKRYYFPDTKW